MPLSVPSLDDLRATTLGQLKARVLGADTSRLKSAIRILGFVIAGGLHLQNRARRWIARQIFIDSAEAPYLDRRIAPYNLPRHGATAAAGNFVFGGTPTIPIPLNQGLVLPGTDVQYVTQATGTIGGGGTVSLAIEAVTPGSAGNQATGAVLQLFTGIAGVQPVGTVDVGGLTGGTDVESDTAYRARGLARIQQPPQGGAATDYLAWIKNGYAGVTRAWVYPLNRGPGTVDITFTMDARVNNVPLTGDVTAAQAAIDAARPVTANALVWAPTADALTITIHGMLPNDAGTQTAVVAQLDALAKTVPPGSATVGDGVSSANPGGTLYLSQIEAAIDAAGGILHYDLAAPVADVTFALGHIPAAPTVAFT